MLIGWAGQLQSQGRKVGQTRTQGKVSRHGRLARVWANFVCRVLESKSARSNGNLLPSLQSTSIDINQQTSTLLFESLEGSLSLILVLIFAKDTHSTHDFTHAQCLDTRSFNGRCLHKPKNKRQIYNYGSQSIQTDTLLYF